METKDIFERMAQQYDTDERIKNAKTIAQAIQAELTDTTDKSAMDYGCGTGLVGLELTSSFKEMIFADISQNMVEQVQRKLLQCNIQNSSTLCCNLCEELPQELQVDYIIMSQVLLHVKDYKLLLNRLYDVLSHDGHLIIVDFDKNDKISSELVHNGFDQAELKELMRQIGFSSVDSHTFYHGKKIFMKEDASQFILGCVDNRSVL